MLNNKTIIPLNLAKYLLFFSHLACGLIGLVSGDILCNFAGLLLNIPKQYTVLGKCKLTVYFVDSRKSQVLIIKNRVLRIKLRIKSCKIEKIMSLSLK